MTSKKKEKKIPEIHMIDYIQSQSGYVEDYSTTLCGKRTTKRFIKEFSNLIEVTCPKCLVLSSTRTPEGEAIRKFIAASFQFTYEYPIETSDPLTQDALKAIDRFEWLVINQRKRENK